MNSLYAIFATPAAGAAIDAAGRAADAARAPFEQLLQLAMQSTKSSAGVAGAVDDDDDAASLDAIARQLQRILEEAGVMPGERVTLEIDGGSGAVAVAYDHPRSGDLQQRLDADPALANAVRQLAEEDGQLLALAGGDVARLEVERAEDGTALLQWR